MRTKCGFAAISQLAAFLRQVKMTFSADDRNEVALAASGKDMLSKSAEVFMTQISHKAIPEILVLPLPPQDLRVRISCSKMLVQKDRSLQHSGCSPL